MVWRVVGVKEEKEYGRKREERKRRNDKKQKELRRQRLYEQAEILPLVDTKPRVHIDRLLRVAVRVRPHDPD